LSDFEFLKLLMLWLKYKNKGGPWQSEFAKFPSKEQFEKYWPEVADAWSQGETPLSWRARQPTKNQIAAAEEGSCKRQ
jgi:hypothetical protein